MRAITRRSAIDALKVALAPMVIAPPAKAAGHGSPVTTTVDGLSGSGTAYGLPSGTYSVVVTAYSPNPPAGYTSSYYQDWRTCYV